MVFLKEKMLSSTRFTSFSIEYYVLNETGKVSHAFLM